MGRPPIGKVAMTGAERVRLHRLKHGITKTVTKPVTKPASPSYDALVQELAAVNAKLEAALAAKPAKAAPASASVQEELLMEQRENSMLQKRVHDLEKALAAKPKPKSEPKPPLDPDSEAARQIKSLKTRVKNLQGELAQERELYGRTLLKMGHMDFKTSSLIAKALHPDSNPSREVREAAYKDFTAWKADGKASSRAK
jgi:hypothetical protein